MIRANNSGSCENCRTKYAAADRLVWRMVDMGTPRQRFQFCPSGCWNTTVIASAGDLA
jgi:hypothetical protein